MSKSILELLDDCLSSNKTEAFLGDSNEILSREESKNKIFSFAKGISSFERDQIGQLSVAILLPRNNDYMAAILGTLLSGNYFIPLNKEWPKEYIEKVLAMADPDILISDETYSSSAYFLHIDELRKTGNVNDVQQALWKNRRYQKGLAYIIFTSGSTGEQKGVMISKMSLNAYAEWTVNALSEYKENKAILQNGELNFDISVADICTALSLNLEIHISPSTQNLIAHALLIKQRKIDTLYGVPTTINRLLRWIETRDDVQVEQLKLIFSGGDILTHDIINLIRRTAPLAHIYNMYGPTEVTMNCLYNRVDNIDLSLDGTSVPTGRLLKHLNAHIINEEGNICSSLDATGELVVGGVQCMEGYLNDSFKTEQAFLDINGLKYYRTGDLFDRTENGLYRFIGRIDTLVKIKGYRINTNTITNVVAELPFITDVCTVVSNDTSGEKSIITYLTMHDPRKDYRKVITAFCEKKLPAYMVPSSFIAIKEFPLGKTGKFDLNKLRSKNVSELNV